VNATGARIAVAGLPERHRRRRSSANFAAHHAQIDDSRCTNGPLSKKRGAHEVELLKGSLAPTRTKSTLF
jgi:hypothetical protein